jgi:hypothetical protein
VLLAYLGTLGFVAVMMRSFYWNLLTILMRNLMTLIIMTLLCEASITFIFVRHFSSLFTMVLHFHCAAFCRLSHYVRSALLHILCDSVLAAHILIAGAALCIVRCGALSLVLGRANCKVAQLTAFLCFLTASFLPPVLLVPKG